MTARVFTVSVLYSHLIKFSQHDLTVVVSDVFFPTHRYPKRFEVVDGGCIVFHVFVMRIRQLRSIGKPTGTEHAQVSKELRIFYTGIKRLYTTHRQTGQGSALRICCCPVTFFNNWHYYLLQFIFKLPECLLAKSGDAPGAEVAIHH